jgi:hypothetical protein
MISFKQTVYVVLTALAMLSIMVVGLFFWSLEQPNCWDLHASEEQAILNCEN